MGDEATEWPGQTHTRRRFLRLPVSLPLVARAPQLGVTALRGMVRTVSAGGLTAEFPVSMVPDCVLVLVFETRHGPVEVEGRVVWTRAIGTTIRHGIAFFEPRPHEFATDLFLSESR
jgi:hypothetical protein